MGGAELKEKKGPRMIRSEMGEMPWSRKCRGKQEGVGGKKGQIRNSIKRKLKGPKTERQEYSPESSPPVTEGGRNTTTVQHGTGSKGGRRKQATGEETKKQTFLLGVERGGRGRRGQKKDQSTDRWKIKEWSRG